MPYVKVKNTIMHIDTYESSKQHFTQNREIKEVETLCGLKVTERFSMWNPIFEKEASKADPGHSEWAVPVQQQKASCEACVLLLWCQG